MIQSVKLRSLFCKSEPYKYKSEVALNYRERRQLTMEMAGDVMKGVRGSTTVLTITAQSLSDLDVQVINSHVELLLIIGNSRVQLRATWSTT